MVKNQKAFNFNNINHITYLRKYRFGQIFNSICKYKNILEETLLHHNNFTNSSGVIFSKMF